MAQQAKRGRPAAKPQAQSTTKPTADVGFKLNEEEIKKTTPKIIQKIKPQEAKVYEIPKGGGVVFMLQSKGITMFDEESQSVREMRYCENEKSVWVDEQSDNAVRKPVLFTQGKLIVPRTKPNLQEFLDKHPQNIANGGNVFKLIQKDVSARLELDKEFSVNEAVSMIRDKNIGDLLPVAMYFNIDINRDSSEIRFDLLAEAKSNPSRFIESFDSPTVISRSKIKQAADYQIINLKENGCYWFDSNRLIIATPVGQDSLEVMSRFCLTEKGASVMASIDEELSKL